MAGRMALLKVVHWDGRWAPRMVEMMAAQTARLSDGKRVGLLVVRKAQWWVGSLAEKWV